jgi:hypothetical protein
MEKIMSERLLQQASQVSGWIGKYNQAVGSTEILPKTPETILASLDTNEACLITGEDGEAMAYGAIYPLIDEVVAKRLGFLPVEIGSMITDSEAQGNGFGSQVARETRKLAEGMSGDLELVALATIKRPVTIKALEKAGIVAVNFFNSPYLSFLTCVCDSGEQNGRACQYRREENQASKDQLIQITDAEHLDENTSVPCTLIAEQGLVEKFEARCRKLHFEFMGESINSGDISVDSFNRIGEFFNQLNQVEVTYE